MSLLLLGERPTEAMSALPSLHTAWAPDDKPLPQLPSPTLSNIDMVLPMTNGHPAMSPPRAPRRPPSPSYLRDRAGPSSSSGGGERGGEGHESPVSMSMSSARAGATRKKERLGLSRKMMMLRSRTSSSGSTARGSPSQGSVDLIPSSPILQDVGNLAPEQPEGDFLQLPRDQHRRTSGSSSSGLSGMTAFLDKYSKAGVTSSDDEPSSDIPPDGRTSVDDDADPDADALRRRQQQEEYASAILSQRAEQILANAKKRLNVMEGNLRGARDLVQPLTAANLKRATSLSGAAIYGNGRTLRYDYDDEQTQSSPRKLHAQQSSPHMGQDYQGHNRNWSDALPDRPYTSLDHRAHYVTTPTLQNPPRSAEQTYERNLRTARSHDQLGGSGAYGMSRALHNRQSPDQNYLEPLAEDEERKSQRHSQHTASSSINNGLGIYRPASRTSDLRDQMSSLKGKISTLKERAREDSIRRQHQSNLQHQTPFNNAATTPPEMFYTQSPVVDEEGPDDHADARRMPEHMADALHQQTWQTGGAIPGSRNAFAEQAAMQPQEFGQARVIKVPASKTPNSKFQVRASSLKPQAQPQVHRRTASGSAIVSSAKSRYSHHQHSDSQGSNGAKHGAAVIDLPSAHIAEHEYLQIPSPSLSANDFTGSPHSSSDEEVPRSEEDYAPSEAESSVYEDAKEQASVVAHEDREDAFDYEHFFLHSAMTTYGDGRRNSQSSEASEASIETARGPALVGYEDDDAFDESSDEYPPATPQTPEKLREIERNLHKRTLSNESITTTGTFATAEEGAEEDDPVSPIDERITYRGSYMQRQHSVSPIHTPSEPSSRVHSRQESHHTQGSSSTYRATSSRQSNSQHGNVVRRLTRRDSSSDRADSGVGMTSRNDMRHPAQAAIVQKHAGKLSNNSATSTPPLSPRDAPMRLDPTTVAVQALLDPNGRQLGLRNKAVLFGVVESLRKVVRQMQEEDDATFASRMLRNTLDEAKRTLDGL